MKIVARFLSEKNTEIVVKTLEVSEVITGTFGEIIYKTNDDFVKPDGSVEPRYVYDRYVLATLIPAAA